MPDIYGQNQPFLQLKATPYIYILLFYLSFSGLMAQNHTLKLSLNSKESDHSEVLQKIKPIDVAIDSIQLELDNFQDAMELKGYLNTTIDSIIKSDSVSIAFINLGPQLEHINIDYSHIPGTLLNDNDLGTYSSSANRQLVRIPFSEIQNFMNTLVFSFEKKGNSFIQVSLKQIKLEQNEATAKLQLDQNFQRKIDKVIVKGYENFPPHFIEHELGLITGSVFNKRKMELASIAINNIPFADELKSPEILFTNDSTIIYLYLKKKKSNQFDGIIGFASKEESSGLEFNGYLDLAINNIFNSGETIALFWKNNGNDRQRFYLEAETPYLFNLPITPKVNFELYRQDSTFNNVKTNASLRYSLFGKGEIAAHLSSENSNDLTSGSTAGISSYSNLFYGFSYSYKVLSASELFPIKFIIDVNALFGSRKIEGQQSNQSKFGIHSSYIYSINERNHIFLRNISELLNSSDFLENELFRIGGTYNLRGVNEESIFASGYTIFNLEYRLQPNDSSFLYSITDYSYSENALTADQTKVLSFGLGYAFQTKAGILNLSYAIGKLNDNPFTFDNSKVHIKIISKF